MSAAYRSPRSVLDDSDSDDDSLLNGGAPTFSQHSRRSPSAEQEENQRADIEVEKTEEQKEAELEEKAQRKLKALTPDVTDISRRSDLYWHYYCDKGVYNYFPVYICNNDEGFYHGIIPNEEKNEVVVCYIIYHRKTQFGIATKETLIPYGGQDPSNHDKSTWCPELFKKYRVYLKQELELSELDIRVEQLVLDEMVRLVEEKEALDDEEEDEVPPLADTFEDLQVDSPVRQRPVLSANGVPDKNEPLRAGDVIEYMPPIFVSGSSHDTVVTTILSINRRRAHMLYLKNMEILPNDTRIRRVKRLVRGKLMDYNGDWRSIEDHKLRKSDLLGVSRADAMREETERVGKVIDKGFDDAKRNAAAAGVGPVDLLKNPLQRRRPQQHEEEEEEEEEGEPQVLASNEKGNKPQVPVTDELLATVQSKPLGMQYMLFPRQEGLWMSEQQAVNELEQILARLESNKSQSVKTYVIPFFRTAIEDNLLALALQHGKLAPLCREHGILHLPYQLTEWLYSVACGPSDATINLSIGASATLLALWKQVRGHAKQPFLLMHSLEKDLKVQFGLATKENIVTNDGFVPSIRDFLGLKHCLLLWEQALKNDIVPRAHPPISDHADTKDEATDCMMALCLAGLDPCSYEHPCINTAFSRVLRALLDFCHERLLDGNDNDFEDWISTTAAKSMEQCHQLGEEYWLSTSLMLYLFPNNMPFSKNCQKFRAVMAIRAIQMCLHVDKWDQHLQSTLAKEKGLVATTLAEKARTSLRWKAISSSYAGLLNIRTLGETFIQNGPRFLATIEIISHLIQTGINLGHDVSPIPQADGDKDETVSTSRYYGSANEASLLHQVIELMNYEFDHLKGKIEPFSSNPMHGRAAYHLKCLCGCLALLKDDGASARAGNDSPTL